MLRQFLAALLIAAEAGAQLTTSVPSWCGKPYQPGYPQYDGSGTLQPPAPSTTQLLNVQVAPQHSIYIANEAQGSFIVNAALSNITGQPYKNSTSVGGGSNATQPFDFLYFTVHLYGNDTPIIQSNVSINSTDNLFSFPLKSFFKPKKSAYHIVLYGASADGLQTYTATTELWFLPSKSKGSAVKVDNLYGGLLFANAASKWSFSPVFSFGFYTQYSGFLEDGKANIQSYADNGFNSVHPEPTYSDNVTTVLSDMDKIGLYYTYDMRNTYQNNTSVTQQVNAVKDLAYLLTWYTADEPDGNQDPLDAPLKASNLIQSLDPYHPVSLVLNCANYYFSSYAGGVNTRILMVDPYPIGINATFSKWGTVCNATYGDCGCDDCEGELSDVSNRLDDINKYQAWLGWIQKPTWAVLQSFHGEGYWDRNPTVAETYAMNSLSVNHGAKGISLWFYPTEDELAAANGAQAKVLQSQPALGFITGAHPQTLNIHGYPLLDLAYWRVGNQIMLGMANLQYVNSKKSVTIPLPFSFDSLQPLWGNVSWTVSNGALSAKGIGALATSLVVLDIRS